MVARFASYFGRAHAVFFVDKYFVVRLSTTKTTKILPPEKYPLYRNSLLLVLNLSEQEKLEIAKQYFSVLSKDMKKEVKEFQDGLLQANKKIANVNDGIAFYCAKTVATN